jgi:hypothetical protein
MLHDQNCQRNSLFLGGTVSMKLGWKPGHIAVKFPWSLSNITQSQFNSQDERSSWKLSFANLSYFKVSNKRKCYVKLLCLPSKLVKTFFSPLAPCPANGVSSIISIYGISWTGFLHRFSMTKFLRWDFHQRDYISVKEILL